MSHLEETKSDLHGHWCFQLHTEVMQWMFAWLAEEEIQLNSETSV